MKILLTSSAKKLKEVIEGKASVTVEAEYGDEVVEGSLLTLAHHGPRRGALCPCLHEREISGVEVIGVSHLDLDTIGGIAAVLGFKPKGESFWQLAAAVDVNGPHKIETLGASEQDVLRLQAWWAWNEEHRLPLPRGDDVADVGEFIPRAIGALQRILVDDDALIEEGRKWASAKRALNDESFIDYVAGVIVRVAPTFVNGLYTTPTGEIGKAVIAYNPFHGSVTVSLADPIEGLSCAAFVQSLWGMTAGGHVGIAGSPRGHRMSMEEFADCCRAFRDLLSRT